MRIRQYLIAIACIILFISGCSSSQTTVPNDFNFSLRFGVQGKNKLSTFDDTFTKDMVIEEPITIELKLTEKEMTSIYDEMKNIDIVSYPEVYKPETLSPNKTFVTPYQTYELVIVYDGKTKKILWEDENLNNSSKAKKLRALINSIVETVQNKEEYEELPQPKGGYM